MGGGTDRPILSHFVINVASDNCWLLLCQKHTEITCVGDAKLHIINYMDCQVVRKQAYNYALGICKTIAIAPYQLVQTCPLKSNNDTSLANFLRVTKRGGQEGGKRAIGRNESALCTRSGLNCPRRGPTLAGGVDATRVTPTCRSSFAQPTPINSRRERVRVTQSCKQHVVAESSCNFPTNRVKMARCVLRRFPTLRQRWDVCELRKLRPCCRNQAFAEDDAELFISACLPAFRKGQSNVFLPYLARSKSTTNGKRTSSTDGQTDLAPGEDREHVGPPAALLAASALDKMHAVRRRDGQAEGVARHLLGVRHLQHLVHVYARLRHCVRLQHATQPHTKDEMHPTPISPSCCKRQIETAAQLFYFCCLGRNSALVLATLPGVPASLRAANYKAVHDKGYRRAAISRGVVLTELRSTIVAPTAICTPCDHLKGTVAAHLRSRSVGAIRATVTRTPGASSLLRSRRAGLSSSVEVGRRSQGETVIDFPRLIAGADRTLAGAKVTRRGCVGGHTPLVARSTPAREWMSHLARWVASFGSFSADHNHTQLADFVSLENVQISSSKCFLSWESCQAMTLVGGFSRGAPTSPDLAGQALLYTHLTSPSSAIKDTAVRIHLNNSAPKQLFKDAHRSGVTVHRTAQFLPTTLPAGPGRELLTQDKPAESIAHRNPEAPCERTIVDFSDPLLHTVASGSEFMSVAERLARCLPPERTGFNLRPDHRIFASGNRAGRCRWWAGFLGDPPFPPPIHSGAAPYSPLFTLIGSQDLAVASRPNLITHSLALFMFKDLTAGESTAAAPRSEGVQKQQRPCAVGESCSARAYNLSIKPSHCFALSDVCGTCTLAGCKCRIAACKASCEVTDGAGRSERG
ncbi:hypothetical protein PR048_009584 [Dryococelus australis]|uniref:Uncharacterized protein n=1 Tax=Dryococelus australis TaxID=614101 RepID=A0ABQ9I0P5_9NEOP|nr:hypothetical protein PR048_009584 [Dryococelus australis]